jgi:hypothetical protein
MKGVQVFSIPQLLFIFFAALLGWSTFRREGPFSN